MALQYVKMKMFGCCVLLRSCACHGPIMGTSVFITDRISLFVIISMYVVRTSSSLPWLRPRIHVRT